MQTVGAGWTAEAKDTVRSPSQNTRISWKRFSTLNNRTFTIGTSSIGGNDIIGANPGSIGSPGNYAYFDESQYVTGLSWERGLKMPLGGLIKAQAEINLDNNSGRFTPRYMGGNSELFTAMLPNRPVIINAGFNIGGVDQTLSQFAGVINSQPEVNQRRRTVRLSAVDYIDYFQDKYLDQSVMFTSQRTDQVMTTLATQLGMNTAQYDFDTGINIIPFGMFEKGTRFADIFDKLAEAENGHFYQNESGIFKFENRQHWDSAPYTTVQKVIYTAQVIDAEAPSDDHLINVVEINSDVYQKQPLQNVFNLPSLSSILVPAGSSVEQFFEFQDPVLALTHPTNGGTNSFYVANTLSDGSGTDMTSSIAITNIGTFAQNVKYRFTNTTASPIYVTQLVLSARIAKKISTLYYREQDDSSVTAYQEHPVQIDNPYIQDSSWAASYARMVLNDFSDVESLQKITIRAFPELQLGDLVSWQGRYWRVYDIKSTFDPSYGYLQELTMLQRAHVHYFIIGVSQIGGSDKIAP
jgi:hypothetical protein